MTDDKYKLRVPQGAVHKYDEKVGRKIFCFAEKILASRTSADMREEFLVTFFGSPAPGDSWHDTAELLSCQSVRARSLAQTLTPFPFCCATVHSPLRILAHFCTQLMDEFNATNSVGIVGSSSTDTDEAEQMLAPLPSERSSTLPATMTAQSLLAEETLDEAPPAPRSSALPARRPQGGNNGGKRTAAQAFDPARTSRQSSSFGAAAATGACTSGAAAGSSVFALARRSSERLSRMEEYIAATPTADEDEDDEAAAEAFASAVVAGSSFCSSGRALAPVSEAEAASSSSGAAVAEAAAAAADEGEAAVVEAAVVEEAVVEEGAREEEIAAVEEEEAAGGQEEGAGADEEADAEADEELIAQSSAMLARCESVHNEAVQRRKAWLGNMKAEATRWTEDDDIAALMSAQTARHAALAEKEKATLAQLERAAALRNLLASFEENHERNKRLRLSVAAWAPRVGSVEAAAVEAEHAAAAAQQKAAEAADRATRELQLHI